MGYTPENNPYIPGDPYSYDLKWIVDHIKELIAQGMSLNDAINALRQQLAGDEHRIAVLENWVHNFDTSYAQQIIQDNIATMIFVSLSDSGYIVYTIPENWTDIIFNTTGLDINLALMPEYGHLVLSY